MGTSVKRVDRVLGYLGLLLIGALGWVADRLPAGPAAPQAATHSRPVHASGRAHA
jgi:hypothetical protein